MSVTEPSSNVTDPQPIPPVSPTSQATGCPPIQFWQDILREFHTQAEVWYAEAEGTRLTGRLIGSGPPILFLNGWAPPVDIWSLTAWLLRDRFTCVLWDTPPARRSESPAQSLKRRVDQLGVIVDKLARGPVCLYATGVGGMLALEAARTLSHRVAHLVLQGAFPHRKWTSSERWLARLAGWLPLQLRHAPGWKAIEIHNEQPWFPAIDKTRFQFHLERQGHTPLATISELFQLSDQIDLTPVLSQIHVPTLLLHTEGEGPAIRTGMQTLGTHLPHVRTETIVNAGSLPHLTHPHRIAKLIESAFTSTTSGASNGPGDAEPFTTPESRM